MDGRPRRARIESLPAHEFTVTRAVAAHLAMHPNERDYETGLAWLLDGIAREVRGVALARPVLGTPRHRTDG